MRRAYREFYELINFHIRRDIPGDIVELGSGMGKIKEIIPDCICSDITENPWIDWRENAYQLTFHDSSVSNLILFDVFHHLAYPGDALNEFHRVLTTSGRVIFFEPDVSILGLLVYGLFHPEPIGLLNKIEWNAPQQSQRDYGYYASQGNAWRIFSGRRYSTLLRGWNLVGLNRYSSIAYLASGGFTGPQLYPYSCYGFMKKIECVCDYFPPLFSTRMLVVLEKVS